MRFSDGKPRLQGPNPPPIYPPNRSGVHPGQTDCHLWGDTGGQNGPAIARSLERRDPTTMAKVIGIDLGTTNSCIAIMDGSQPRVIENSEEISVNVVSSR